MKKTNSKAAIAETEYNRLKALFKAANVDENLLAINDKFIHKTAEIYAQLETLKELPFIIYDLRTPSIQRETPAGRAYTRTMAQYTSCMQKLNKILTPQINEDEDELNDYDD